MLDHKDFSLLSSPTILTGQHIEFFDEAKEETILTLGVLILQSFSDVNQLELNKMVGVELKLRKYVV